MTIRTLTATDADAFAAFRREALVDSPLAFGASPDDDFVSSPEAAVEYLGRGDDFVIFGAFEGAQLAGAVGMARDHHRKSSHKAHLWGMFVRPPYRGRGIGRALVDAAVARARVMPGITRVDLAVSSVAASARRLYQRAGFAVWGTEPDALRDGGRSVAEDHMVLAIGAAGADDRAAVIAATKAMFAAMKAKDERAMRTVISPEATFLSIRATGQKALVRTGDEFVRGILSNPATLEERLLEAKVGSDGRIASLQAAYDFHIDGRFSHRGTDLFLFLREAGGWVLISAAYTVE